MTSASTTDIVLSTDGHVTTIEMRCGAHNFVDADFLRRLADVFDDLSAQPDCRAVVLASGVRSFSAGADFSSSVAGGAPADLAPFYENAMRLFGFDKPIVAAVQGAAIGAGLGLALVADFRVTCQEARLSASFTRLGFHPGFAMSLSLPRLVGEQQAAMLFYTGRRIDGAQAVAMGLADELVPVAEVRARATALAQEIAASAPIAVQATRATLRGDLAQRAIEINRVELAKQRLHFETQDFREGVTASQERRAPVFKGC